VNDRGDPLLGAPLDRVDGPQKVTGHATYAADFALDHLCHGVMVTTTVPSGTMAAIDTSAATAMPGVLFILTHENAPRLPQGGRAGVKPPAGRETSLLQDNRVRYNNEPVAVVVAATLEQAVDAASRVRIRYDEMPAVLRFEDAKRHAHPPPATARGPTEKNWGEPARALADAEVTIERVYTTPMEHHNPLEPHATVAHWHGDRLTLYDSTQNVFGVRDTVAKTLGMPEENVRVVSPFVGGGFGSKGSTWSHVILAALAARAVNRPVKLALTRAQMFGPVGGRPCTEQHLALGARRDGSLVAVRHISYSHTSVFEDYAEPAAQPTRALYACPHGATTHRVVPLNVGTPTFQRAPGEATGSFAIESAMDELAEALGIDPVELRLRNHAEVEPSSGKPWSSKKLRECYADAAQRFGWSRRSPRTGSMRDGRWRVGWGMATATYPAHRAKAQALAMLTEDGDYVVRSCTQDIGTGTYTIATQVAAATLGVSMEQVHFELGDTRFPRAPVSGGSMTAASVGTAVRAACLGLRAKIEAGGKAPLEALGESAPPEEDDANQRHAERSFGAVFTEVRVDEDLGIIRVPRVVATYSVGRLLNGKTALSQLQGGIVWGIGMALLEESVPDPRYGRIVNGNLADYAVPVNADVGAIEVAVVDECDLEFNELGIRGIGEIGITGVAGAIANAVYHATGKRVRDLPITLDKLL
jgi:xanthine dehydrogenase YagR molybdenum-binding subunit